MSNHKNNPLCSIIIPVFNQIIYTQECIDAIFKNTEYPSFEVIIVNNGSTDETLPYITFLKEDRSNIKIIDNFVNKGFSTANNDGAKIARGDYLIFLNNDTIPQKGWLSNLALTADDENIAVVGSKLIYPDTKKINHAGYVFNAELGHFYLIYHNSNPDIPAVNKQREFQAVLGACMLIKKDIFVEIGMFAEYGLEDIDFCLKAREKGYKVIYSPKSRLYHYGSVTLRNSPANSYVKADLNGFKKRWKAENIVWDDFEYYKEDGYKLSYDKDGEVVLADLNSPSNECLNKALICKKNGETDKAVNLFIKAIEIHPCNKIAYINLISALVEKKDFKQAIHFCKGLLEVDPHYLEGYIYWSELLLGASDSLQQLLRDRLV